MRIGIKGRGASGGALAPATGYSPGRLAINIDRQVVDRHRIFEVHLCIIVWYTCIAIEG